MKKIALKKKVIAFISTFALGISMFSISALGKTETISLAKNQVWNTRPAVARSGNHGYVKAKCTAVYPASGKDTYKSIQCTAVDSSGKSITTLSKYTLGEGKGYQSLYIKDGKLGIRAVKFKFRGNKKVPAKADVSYLGK